MKGTRPGDVSADRHRRRLGKADDELVGWFRSNVGVRAQGYEPGHAFDSHELHASRLRSMRWLMGGHGAREWFDRVAVTVAQAPMRSTLELVYTPRSSTTWLADALSPPWGGGSFVALAATLDAAHVAANGEHVPTWFETLGRGSHTKLLRTLCLECEALRVEALKGYELLRVDRVKREQAEEREAKRLREKANEELYEAEVGKTRRRSADRFDARIRRVA